MSKAILILDEMPGSCCGCLLHNYHFCNVTNKPIDEDVRPDHCPLQEPPEYQLVWHEDSNWELGYNWCLDDILEKEED